jgi:hypothetical protein
MYVPVSSKYCCEPSATFTAVCGTYKEESTVFTDTNPYSLICKIFFHAQAIIHLLK